MSSKVMVLDIETENNPYFGAVASPRHPENYVVAVLRAIKEEGAPELEDVREAFTKEVVKQKKAEAFQANLTCIPFEPEGFGIVSEVETDRGLLTVVWDTGAQHSLLRDERATSVGNPGMEQRNLRIGDEVYSVELAAYPFEEPPVDAYLGYDFFSAHAVYFNLSERCLAVDPPR